MKISLFNASMRKDGDTTALAAKALEGAATLGAETEMIFLGDHEINYCANCLKCYRDLKSTIAPCPQNDAMAGLLEKLYQSDGVILASPVHSGFVNGLLTTFLERAVWTMCKPTGELMGLKGCPEPRDPARARASASIMNAGGVPPEMRRYCDLGTPWLWENCQLMFNGPFVGDVYAGALFDPRPRGEEWAKAYTFKRLSREQLAEAFALGKAVAAAIQAGLKPFDPAELMASGPA